MSLSLCHVWLLCFGKYCRDLRHIAFSEVPLWAFLLSFQGVLFGDVTVLSLLLKCFVKTHCVFWFVVLFMPGIVLLWIVFPRAYESGVFDHSSFVFFC